MQVPSFLHEVKFCTVGFYMDLPLQKCRILFLVPEELVICSSVKYCIKKVFYIAPGFYRKVRFSTYECWLYDILFCNHAQSEH